MYKIKRVRRSLVTECNEAGVHPSRVVAAVEQGGSFERGHKQKITVAYEEELSERQPLAEELEQAYSNGTSEFSRVRNDY